MSEEELIHQTQTLIKRFDNMSITGPGWSGDARNGFMFTPPTGACCAGSGGGPPPPGMGACCFEDGTCAIETLGQCDLDGGRYQGDGTVCDPNPCLITGACCKPGCICSSETEFDCVSGGGTWSGAGSLCTDYAFDTCQCATGTVELNVTCFHKFNVVPCCTINVAPQTIDITSGFCQTICISNTIPGHWQFPIIATIDHTDPYPPGCDPGINCNSLWNVSGAFIDLSFFWDCVSGWEICASVVFPHEPATFNLGCIFPGLVDLTQLGSIDVTPDWDNCPGNPDDDTTSAGFTASFTCA